MERSKYNVSSSTTNRTYNGIIFDSAMEMKYYRDVVLPLTESGDVIEYELQKSFELQPKFKYKNKTVQPITYVADFFMRYKDGYEEVIEIKGCPDNTALLKKKMFLYHYPNIPLRWVTYSGIDGGWCEYQDVVKNRQRRKKEKLKDKKEK